MMETARDIRRNSGTGGPVSAPRRPRTSGMKDVPGMPLTTGVSGLRNKRKRPPSSDPVTRSSTAEDLDDDEDDAIAETEFSEDEEELAPLAVRRSGKPRVYVSKSFEEETVTTAVSLPAVPRKARTATGKRSQEQPLSHCGEIPTLKDGRGETRPASPNPGPSTSRSPSPSRPVGAATIAVLSAAGRGASGASASFAVVSTATAKQGKRLKIPPGKPKVVKVSRKSPVPPSISEQEVEVANALFDLANLFTSAHSETTVPSIPSPETAKVEGMDSNAEPKEEDVSVGFKSEEKAYIGAVRVLEQSNAAGAPKRKRPRVRNRQEDTAGDRVVPKESSAPASSSSIGAHKGERDVHGIAETVEAKLENQGTAKLTTPRASDTAGVLQRNTSSQKSGSVEKRAAAERRSLQNVKAEESHSDHLSEKKVNCDEGLEDRGIPEQLGRQLKSDVVCSRELKEASKKPSGNVTEPGRGLKEAMGDVDAKKRPVLVSESGAMKATKQDINQQVTPAKPSGNLALLAEEIEQVTPEAPSKAEGQQSPLESNSWDENKRPMHQDKGIDAEQELEKGFDRKRNDRQIDSASDIVKQREREMEKERQGQLEKEKDRETAGREKEHSSKPAALRVSKASRGEMRAQKTERVVASAASAATSQAAPPFISSVPVISSAAASSAVNSGANAPLSMGMSSWPASIGYYPPAAAAAAAAVAAAAAAGAWPSGVSSSMPPPPTARDEPIAAPQQLPPSYMLPPRPWKRCASHVYIAKMIGYQQKLSRSSNFYSAFHTGFGGHKPYSVNMTLPPGEGGIFGAGVSGPLPPEFGGSLGHVGPGSALSTVPAAQDRGLEFGELGQNLMPGQTGNSCAKERGSGFSESVGRKSSQEQQQAQGPAGQQQGIPSPSQGSLTKPAGHLYNYSQQQGGGNSTGVRPASNGNGPSFAAAGSGVSTGNGASIGGSGGGANGSSAVAQAQFNQLQSQLVMMQQGGFPFNTFPQPHFGHPPFNGPGGHLAPQQAAQFFSTGPYFGGHPHLVHVQPPQQAGPSSGASVPSQKTQLQGSTQSQGPGQGGGRAFSSVLHHHSQLHQGQQHQPPHEHPESPSHRQQQQPQQQLAAPHPPQHHSSERESSGGGGDPEKGFGGLMHPGRYAPRSTVGQGQPPHSPPVGPPGSAIGGLHSELPFMPGPVVSGSKTQQQQQQVQQSAASQVGGPQNQQQQTQTLGGVGLKGLDTQTGGNMSVITMSSLNRGGIGPGPLGLAPVAAVMAPQGHALLQGMENSPTQQLSHHHQHQQAQMGPVPNHSLPMMGRGTSLSRQLEDARPTEGVGSVYSPNPSSALGRSRSAQEGGSGSGGGTKGSSRRSQNGPGAHNRSEPELANPGQLSVSVPDASLSLRSSNLAFPPSGALGILSALPGGGAPNPGLSRSLGSSGATLASQSSNGQKQRSKSGAVSPKEGMASQNNSHPHSQSLGIGLDRGVIAGGFGKALPPGMQGGGVNQGPQQQPSRLSSGTQSQATPQKQQNKQGGSLPPQSSGPVTTLAAPIAGASSPLPPAPATPSSKRHLALLPKSGTPHGGQPLHLPRAPSSAPMSQPATSPQIIPALPSIATKLTAGAGPKSSGKSVQQPKGPSPSGPGKRSPSLSPQQQTIAMQGLGQMPQKSVGQQQTHTHLQLNTQQFQHQQQQMFHHRKLQQEQEASSPDAQPALLASSSAPMPNGFSMEDLSMGTVSGTALGAKSGRAHTISSPEEATLQQSSSPTGSGAAAPIQKAHAPPTVECAPPSGGDRPSQLLQNQQDQATITQFGSPHPAVAGVLPRSRNERLLPSDKCADDLEQSNGVHVLPPASSFHLPPISVGFSSSNASPFASAQASPTASLLVPPAFSSPEKLATDMRSLSTADTSTRGPSMKQDSREGSSADGVLASPAMAIPAEDSSKIGSISLGSGLGDSAAVSPSKAPALVDPPPPGETSGPEVVAQDVASIPALMQRLPPAVLPQPLPQQRS